MLAPPRQRRTPRLAQASLEYIFTYGWVFLVILVVITAISYIGVFTPGRFAPESCQLTDKLQCVDALILGTTDGTPGRLVVKIYNAYERSMDIASAEGQIAYLDNCDAVTIRPGETDDLSCELSIGGQGQSPVIGEKPQIAFTVRYRPTNSGLPPFVSTGSVRAKVLDAADFQSCSARGLNLCAHPEKCPYGWEEPDYEPGTCCAPQCIPAPQCSDTLDNDGDGCTDAGSDDNCVSANDLFEAGSACYSPPGRPGGPLPAQASCAASGGRCCPGKCLTAPLRAYWGGCGSPEECCPIAFGNFCQLDTECSDGRDNDEDLLRDYPDDPQCSSLEDRSESP